ncbi:related to TIP41 - negatively regulates the TOR signaling pathway [Cephalotrichum gorgonifer]|uniref:Related to TIP41 - negatively regulates the TOR signaling pathway n=1 Tax=Cephalotrichum gorgonifer TaxID=2041049 RepID=A0AAE8N0S7_9PEZI|nr:related to TIP41 - negatively regulates the TOR signaling pathway [Cephalotrichum gorgonifer]
MSKRLGIPVPEMIFGDNLVLLRHAPTGWTLAFNAFDALDAVGKDASNMLQVAYAQEWASSRDNVKEVVNPFDWSYSSTYDGTLAPGSASFAPTERAIPLELLKRRDPILFFDEVVLYESELDDNGISLYSVKVRLHEKRMLLLARLFVRVDNVIVRVRDTRVYVDFETDEVIREYTAREDSFANVKQALRMTGTLPDDLTIALRDPNILAPLIPIVESRLESVNLKR